MARTGSRYGSFEKSGETGQTGNGQSLTRCAVRGSSRTCRDGWNDIIRQLPTDPASPNNHRRSFGAVGASARHP